MIEGNHHCHIFLDGTKVRDTRMHQVPSVDDVMRFGENYAIVKEVIWCMDESDSECINLQRVNIKTETE